MSWFTSASKLTDIKKGHQLNILTSEQKDIRKQSLLYYFFSCYFRKYSTLVSAWIPALGGGGAVKLILHSSSGDARP